MTALVNLPAANVAALPVGNLVRPIIPQNYTDTVALATGVCRAGLANKFGNDPSKVTAIMLSGMEVGLKPMAALRLFYVTQEGQPALLARGMLAVVQASGQLEYWEDRLEGEGEERRAVVVCKRRGFPAITRTFGAKDARKAGLSNRQTYSKYDDRMYWNRAVSYAVNDMFADQLCGLYEPSEIGGPVIDDNGQVIAPPVEPAPAIIPPEPSPSKAAKPPLVIHLPDGSTAEFPRTRAGLKEAYEFMSDGVIDGQPQVVELNKETLDKVVETMPDMAEKVADLRAAAAMALMPDYQPDYQQEEPDRFVERFVNGDEPETDDFPGDIPPRS